MTLLLVSAVGGLTFKMEPGRIFFVNFEDVTQTSTRSPTLKRGLVLVRRADTSKSAFFRSRLPSIMSSSIRSSSPIEAFRVALVEVGVEVEVCVSERSDAALFLFDDEDGRVEGCLEPGGGGGRTGSLGGRGLVGLSFGCVFFSGEIVKRLSIA